MNRFFALFLCILLAVALSGCGNVVDTPSPSETFSADQPAAEVFAQAKSNVLATDNRILTYTKSCSRTVNNQTFSELVTGTASFSALNTEAFDAIVEESLTYGTYTSAYRESYCGGSAYCSVDNRVFSTVMTAEDFIARQLPAVLLDETLYGSISLQATDEGAVISFSQPTAMESWASDRSSSLLSASGTATLNAVGELVQTTYSAQYMCGTATYSLQMTVKISTPETLDLSVLHPDHTQNCVQIASLDAPKFLLRCVGNLFTSQAISSEATESTVCEAIPLKQIRVSQYAIVGSGVDTGAAIRHQTSYQDYRNEPLVTTEDHTLIGGVCTYTANGGTPLIMENITAEQIRTQIEDAVLSAVFALQYISDAQVADSGDAYHLTFLANEAYCADLNANLQNFLDVDLDKAADRFEDTAAGGHLTIDKDTLLPTSLGMNFTRIHSFGKVDYSLSYELVHNLSLASTTANEDILENP